MSDDNELVLTSPTSETRISRRTAPTLIQLGARLVPSDGRFHPRLAAEYIRDHGGRTRWIPMGELAKVFFSGNTPHNKRQMRHRLFLVWREVLGLGHLLVVETDGRSGAALSCKIYDPHSTEERQYLQARLERMEKQRFLKAEQFEKARALAECLDQKVATE